MSILTVIGLSLLVSLTVAPVLAQDATPTTVGCTAGSSGIGDPYYPLLGNSGFDVQHYTLDLDPEGGEHYGSGWWHGREEIFLAGDPAGAESWFPVNGHPADKATYTLRLTVPQPYSVVANGLLTETIATETGTTTVWQSRDPMASYLVTLHAGRLTTEVREGPHGLPIRTAFAASVPRGQRVMFDRMPEMIDYFESVFGPYPFESAGATIVGAPLPFALETQTLPVFGEIPLVGNTPLVGEELAGFEAI